MRITRWATHCASQSAASELRPVTSLASLISRTRISLSAHFASHEPAYSKNVKFCAYSIPHPNDRKVLLQIQVYPGRGSALQALQQGLRDLLDVTQHVKTVLKVCRRRLFLLH